MGKALQARQSSRSISGQRQAGQKMSAIWLPGCRQIAQRFPNLVLFSIGAGIDAFDLAALFEHISIVRVTEASIADGMAEYVMMAVLGLHRDLLTYVDQQRRGVWQELRLVLADSHRVGVIGLGILGSFAGGGEILPSHDRHGSEEA
jgi:glyoxylate/hydroxypyruvate reductase A